MKGTKELVILALPLLAAGCGGGSSSTSPPPPPASVDPEGIYQGAAGAGDTIFGIVTADGTADFLEFSGSLASLTTSTPFVVLAPNNIVPDVNGNYSASYNGFSGNGYVLPSGDIIETGTLSGLAQAASSLSGNYTVTGGTPASINYNLTYQSSYYETPASSTLANGTYSVAIIVGASQYAGGTFTITAGTSATQATITGTDGVTSCNYSGTVTVPDTTYNAYQFSIQSSGGGCPLVFDNLAGLGTLLTVGSTPTMFAILSDAGTQQGVLMILTSTG